MFDPLHELLHTQVHIEEGCQTFWEHLLILLILFGEILTCAGGNFEQQNGVLYTFIVIINYCII
jgi:hypothetical protein